MEVFKGGAVLNIKFGPFFVFSRVFFTPPRYDYPLDATLVLWQYESRIRGGLLHAIGLCCIELSVKISHNLTSLLIFLSNYYQWCQWICFLVMRYLMLYLILWA